MVVNPYYTPKETDALLQRLFPAQVISDQARLGVMYSTVERLLSTAVSDLQISRSTAYLFSDVLSKCPSNEVAQILKEFMERKAIALLSAQWFGAHGAPPITVCKKVAGLQTQFPATGGPSRGKQWQDKFNIAAFLGDLFAIGVVSPEMMCIIMTSWAKHLTSSVQYNGLYLLLLRASYPLVTPIRANCALQLKDTLITNKHHENLWWTVVSFLSCFWKAILTEILTGNMSFG